MSVKTTTVYNCDYCQKQLPDDYATTNGEGKGYYVKKAHDTIPLDPFNWLVQKDTPEFMQIIHKYSGTVRKIKKKVAV